MSTRNSDTPLAADVADRLHSVAIHLLRHARQVDGQSGLSAARLSALSVLVFGGPRTIGELAASEQVRPPTMSTLVRHLVADRLVRTARDESDRRVVRVSATARARDVLERARRRRGAVLSGLFGSLSTRERSGLVRTLDALERALARATEPDAHG